MDKQTALDIHTIWVSYNSTPALERISISIPRGALLGIIGPNGAGKSTLLKAIMGLVKPASGTIKIFGKPITQQRKSIAYVPQRASVDWDFPINVFDVVMMGRYGHLGWFGRPGPRDKKIVRDALEAVGMEQLAHRHISQLSGGQQQRVFLARALAQKAQIYLMDEPFAGVDARTERVILDILMRLSDEGKAVIVVHHDLHTVQTYFTTALLLNQRLVASGPVAQVVTPGNIEQAYGAGKAFEFVIQKRAPKS